MKRRSAGVTTMAILNLVFGGLFLICGVVNITQQSNMTVNGRDISQDVTDYLDTEVPGYSFMRVGGPVLTMIFAVGFVISGVGLLQVQSWGRVLAIVIAGISILNQLFQAFYTLALVNPAIKRYFATGTGINLIGGMATGFTTMAIVVTSVFIVAYDVILLVMMLQSTTSRVFSGEYRGEEVRDDRRRSRYDDDDDDYDRPRRRAHYDDDDDDDRPRRRSSRRDDYD
jgi:hypothetical protein